MKTDRKKDSKMIKRVQILFLFQVFLASFSNGAKKAKTFFDLSAKDIEGNEVQFDSFRGKVVMVSNSRLIFA